MLARYGRQRAGATRNPALSHSRSIVIAFALVILVGTGLLMLPISQAGFGGASFLEALFTSTSAVCVTGHVVVDTATYWTPFGQVVIMTLIQVGGLGIMTSATLIGLVVVRKLSLRSRLTTAAEARGFGLDDFPNLLGQVVKTTLLIEVAVAALLFCRFTLGYGEPVGRAAWLAVFHSVSAFNNAGFSLFGDNLVSYVSDPWICLPIAAAIILGGIGFPVILQLRKHWGDQLRWTMNTRIVLLGTIILLVAGTAYVTAIEWSNPATLGPMDWPTKVLVGFFTSVQTRTAGFNSIDIGSMDPASWIGMDALMLIGAGPAGTAGGIKVTTFAVLFFIVMTEVRHRGAVNVLGKRLPRSVHREAITVVLLAVATVVTATVALMLLTDISLDRLLFEAVSAFGTVGLSTGITADLPPAGQVILILLMFIGRLGPITFASGLALNDRSVSYELPKERPIIG